MERRELPLRPGEHFLIRDNQNPEIPLMVATVGRVEGDMVILRTLTDGRNFSFSRLRTQEHGRFGDRGDRYEFICVSVLDPKSPEDRSIIKAVLNGNGQGLSNGSKNNHSR